MSYLLYAIVHPDNALSLVLPAGPDGHAVRLIGCEDLAAACSVVPDDFRRPSMTQLLAYGAVIDALHRQTTVLPLRYGCLLEGEPHVRDLLLGRRTDFSAALVSVADCLEMGLRLMPMETASVHPEPTPAKISSGAAYLAAKRARFDAEAERRRLGESIASRLHEVFSAVLVDFAASPVPRFSEPFSYHFLIRRSDRPCFESLFQQFQAESRASMILTGPWPPYHFVNP